MAIGVLDLYGINLLMIWGINEYKSLSSVYFFSTATAGGQIYAILTHRKPMD